MTTGHIARANSSGDARKCCLLCSVYAAGTHHGYARVRTALHFTRSGGPDIRNPPSSPTTRISFPPRQFSASLGSGSGGIYDRAVDSNLFCGSSVTVGWRTSRTFMIFLPGHTKMSARCMQSAVTLLQRKRLISAMAAVSQSGCAGGRNHGQQRRTVQRITSVERCADGRRAPSPPRPQE